MIFLGKSDFFSYICKFKNNIKKLQNIYKMTVKQIAELLEAKILCGTEEQLNEDITTAFASDLMSDVLTLKQTPLLVTGLCNLQTIRTCEMAGLDIIIFVRKKKATEEMIELAEDNDMVLIESDFSMFKACGLMYANDIKPLF